MLTRLSALAVAAALAFPALADPSPPVLGPGLQVVGLGIFCQPGTYTRQAAPETSLGYIHLMEGTPVVAFSQQQVPARLGIHFGIIVVTDRDIPEMRAETWKPGATKPEVWYTESAAGVPRARGYMFEFPEELTTGTWRMDAFDGDTMLYSVEFEVLPGTELPGVTSDCNLLA